MFNAERLLWKAEPGGSTARQSNSMLSTFPCLQILSARLWSLKLDGSTMHATSNIVAAPLCGNERDRTCDDGLCACQSRFILQQGKFLIFQRPLLHAPPLLVRPLHQYSFIALRLSLRPKSTESTFTMYQIGNIYFITAIAVLGGALFGFDIASLSAM